MSQESVYIASVDELTGPRKFVDADSPYKFPKHPNYIQHEPYSERIG